MKLILTTAALKGLRKIPTKDATALYATLEEIAADPIGEHPKAKKLVGLPGYRARQGDWRAIYTLDREADEMIVDLIGNRGEVYR
jgi:mRNA interferase RelE/StbE